MRGWRRSLNRPTTRWSARRSTGSSCHGTAGPKGYSGTRPPKPSASTSRWSFPRSGARKRTKCSRGCGTARKSTISRRSGGPRTGDESTSHSRSRRFVIRREKSSARRRWLATSPSESGRRRRSWKPIASRRSSWRRSPTSCAIRWPRSAIRCTSCGWERTPRRPRPRARNAGTAGQPPRAAGG